MAQGFLAALEDALAKVAALDGLAVGAGVLIALGALGGGPPGKVAPSALEDAAFGTLADVTLGGLGGVASSIVPYLVGKLARFGGPNIDTTRWYNLSSMY